MTASAVSVVSALRVVSTTRLGRAVEVLLLGVFPVATVVTLFATAIRDDAVATDFEQFYLAGQAILDGASPYAENGRALAPWGGPFPYPPPLALLATPFTALSLDAGGIAMMTLLCGAAVATLLALDIRDWRCYGVVFLWPPVLSAIQTGNVTLLLGLAAAVAWRFRERPWPSSVAVGLTLAAKFFLWPLVVWLAATRRVLAAVVACLVGVVVLVASWAAIGFAGMTSYPDLTRRLEDAVGMDSYTAYVVGRDLGLPSPAARLAWLAVGCALLVILVVIARRGDERSAFVVAVAAALCLTPIVWLHYFALLLVVVAVATHRLGVVWFVPLLMVVTPGSGHPTPFETAWTLGIAALTVGLSLRISIARGEAATVDVTRVEEAASA